MTAKEEMRLTTNTLWRLTHRPSDSMCDLQELLSIRTYTWRLRMGFSYLDSSILRCDEIDRWSMLL